MGSAFHAWQSFLPKKPERNTPASDLVKSIIGIQERKAERERRDRIEARQAEIDAEAQLDRDRKRADEDAKHIAAIAQTLSPQVEQPLEGERFAEAAQGLGETPEFLSQMPDGLPTLGMQKQTPEGTFEFTGDRWAKVSDEAPTEMVDREPMMQDFSLFGGGKVAAPFRPEARQRMYEDLMLDPSIINAQAENEFKETPEERQAREIEVAKAREEAKGRRVIQVRAGNRIELRDADNPSEVLETIPVEATPGTSKEKTYMGYDKKINATRPIKESEWLANPEQFTDKVSGRTAQEDQMTGEKAWMLIDKVDSNLKRYESASAIDRLKPSFYVVRDAYISSVSSLGQMFGRQVLRDVRVSNEDRRVYTSTIGQTNDILMMLDPTEARKRFELLKEMYGDYNRKYPPGAPEGVKNTVSPKTEGPAVGTVEDGYRFKGGDPSNQENWEKI